MIMTQVSRDDVLTLARLSSLQLADDEAADLQTDIDNILGYVRQLDELSTDGIEPTYQVTGRENIWRGDDINQPLERDDLISLAPASLDHQVKVPKVL